MTSINFSKVIKGTQKPFKATLYVEGSQDCTLTELEFEGKKKIDGLETMLWLQEPIKYTPASSIAKAGAAEDEDEEEDEREFERSWVAGRGGVNVGGDDEEEGEERYTVHWEKIVLKEFGAGGNVDESMAWIALGEKSEDVLTTENWKD